MATESQIAANRLNAAKSTGPRTEEGKASSRFNSLKHGLAAETLVLPHENAGDYATLRTELLDANHPANLHERMLVDKLAQTCWRMMRTSSAETGILDNGIRGLQQEMNLGSLPQGREDEALAVYLCSEKDINLDRFLRYHAAAERSYYRALEALRRAQNDRRRLERDEKIGSVPQRRAAAANSPIIHNEIARPPQPSAPNSEIISNPDPANPGIWPPTLTKMR
jgi:hypothetical protein